MNTFDGTFFGELQKLDALVKLGEYDSELMKPRDGFRLRLSELQEAGKVSDKFVRVTRAYVDMLAERSDGRYLLEKDFRVHPHRVYSYSLGRSGRKQLHIGFDAYPPSGLYPYPWGASVGLGFDFRNEHGIVNECVNDFEEFHEKVFCEPALFDATLGHLGGYAEPTQDFEAPLAAEQVSQYTPDMSQRWLFFGRRLLPDAITSLGSREEFVGQCIRVFDVICEGGYYNIKQDR